MMLLFIPKFFGIIIAGVHCICVNGKTFKQVYTHSIGYCNKNEQNFLVKNSAK